MRYQDDKRSHNVLSSINIIRRVHDNQKLFDILTNHRQSPKQPTRLTISLISIS